MDQQRRVVMTRDEFDRKAAGFEPPRPDDVNSPVVVRRMEASRDGVEREIWRLFGYDPDNPPA